MNACQILVCNGYKVAIIYFFLTYRVYYTICHFYNTVYSENINQYIKYYNKTPYMALLALLIAYLVIANLVITITSLYDLTI